MVMYYFAVPIFILIDLHENNIWVKRTLSILMMLLIAAIMAGNYNNPDYLNYFAAYTTSQTRLEFGYRLLTKLSIFLGLSYTEFRFFVYFAGTLLINESVRKFDESGYLFYIMYLIYPMMMDIVQVRNYLVMALMTFGLPFLAKNDLRGRLEFLACTLLASTFQLTALVYLPLFFAKDSLQPKTLKIWLAIILCLSLVLGLNRSLVNMLLNYAYMFWGSADDRISQYSVTDAAFGFIIFWALQLGFLWVTWKMKALSEEEEFEGRFDDIQRKMINILLFVDIFACLFLPLYVMHTTFFRIFRNLIPIHLIVYIMILEKTQLEDHAGCYNKKALWLMLAAFALLGMLFFIDIYLGYSKTIVEPVHKDNWIMTMQMDRLDY